MTECLHCNAETTNGLVLCDLSQMKAAKALEFIPVYFRNLARWKPGRAGSRPVPGSRVLWAGERSDAAPDRITRALDATFNDLMTWSDCLYDDRGAALPKVADDEAGNVAALCRYLAEHLASIGTLGWAGEFVDRLDDHEDALRRLTEHAVPGWYAGGCRQEIAATPDGPLLCDSGVYVVPGLTWVTCRACGVTTYARDHLETVLDEARDWVARPKALAEAVVALVDTEPSVPQLYDRIRQWSSRGDLTGFRKVDDDGDEVGPKRYRLGDVLDLIFIEDQSRDTMPDAVVAS